MSRATVFITHSPDALAALEALAQVRRSVNNDPWTDDTLVTAAHQPIDCGKRWARQPDLTKEN